MTHVKAVILTYNEAVHIEACIISAWLCADSVLVFDSFSDDDTLVIARSAGADVMQREFSDYASQRNAALESVNGQADWVLFIDADERVTPELAAEVRSAVEQQGFAGWQIPRHNYIFGKLTLGAGWYPDYQLRLLRVGYAQYDPERKVHEVVVLDGAEGTFTQPFIHYNYRDIEQFRRKQRKYTAYNAHILYEQGIRPKPQNYILQPMRQFWWRFVTLRGFRDGLHGLQLSLLMAWFEFRKYQRLRGLWRGR